MANIDVIGCNGLSDCFSNFFEDAMEVFVCLMGEGFFFISKLKFLNYCSVRRSLEKFSLTRLVTIPRYPRRSAMEAIVHLGVSVHFSACHRDTAGKPHSLGTLHTLWRVLFLFFSASVSSGNVGQSAQL